MKFKTGVTQLNNIIDKGFKPGNTYLFLELIKNRLSMNIFDIACQISSFNTINSEKTPTILYIQLGYNQEYNVDKFKNSILSPLFNYKNTIRINTTYLNNNINTENIKEMIEVLNEYGYNTIGVFIEQEVKINYNQSKFMKELKELSIQYNIFSINAQYVPNDDIDITHSDNLCYILGIKNYNKIKDTIKNSDYSIILKEETDSENIHIKTIKNNIINSCNYISPLNSIKDKIFS